MQSAIFAGPLVVHGTFAQCRLAPAGRTRLVAVAQRKKHSHGTSVHFLAVLAGSWLRAGVALPRDLGNRRSDSYADGDGRIAHQQTEYPAGEQRQVFPVEFAAADSASFSRIAFGIYTRQ